MKEATPGEIEEHLRRIRRIGQLYMPLGVLFLPIAVAPLLTSGVSFPNVISTLVGIALVFQMARLGLGLYRGRQDMIFPGVLLSFIICVVFIIALLFTLAHVAGWLSIADDIPFPGVTMAASFAVSVLGGYGVWTLFRAWLTLRR